MTNNKTSAPSVSTPVGAKVTAIKSRARHFRAGARLLLLGAALLLAPMAHAQVQRSFINLGFEQPVLTPRPTQNGQCYIITSSDDVPGWNTTHPTFSGSGPGTNTCESPTTHQGPAIELWHHYLGVPARDGENNAELNANQASRIYQTVCLERNETVEWKFSHRGRDGSDSAAFNIGPNPNGPFTTIVRVETNQNGGGAPRYCPNGGTCHVNPFQNDWADYSGSFNWSGASGLQTVGFEAISTGSPDISQGNLLDDIQLILKPFVEFSSKTYVTPEGTTTNLPTLRLTGTVPAGGITIPISIVGGTATLGEDYTTPGGAASFSVTVAAGTYDLLEIPLKVTAPGDAVIDDNRTVQLTVNTSSAYNLASTTTCGSAPNVTSTWTIADDDVDMATSKTVSTPTPNNAADFTYTVTYRNNTARPTVAPLNAHDITATIADALPAGVLFKNWTCQAANGATCAAASGSGAISGSASLPAGNAAAGGTLTYTITASLSAAKCSAIKNTATIAPTGKTEGTTAASDFNTPAPGGTGNNTASADVTPVCADLSITKTATSNSVRSGNDVSYKIVVRNAGPRWASGAVVTDPQPAGLDCSAGTVTCSTTNGAVCPNNPTTSALQGSGLAIPTFPSGSSVELTLTCKVSASGSP